MSNCHLKLDERASSAVDSYLEYSRIVRGDDKGVTFNPEQYEAYKKRVIPMRIKNRLYVCWTNEAGMDCKIIGPETQCFCNHRYHQHRTDIEELPAERPVHQPCEVSGCTCDSYRYTPMVGHKFVFCGCRHTPKDHSPVSPFKCEKANCSCDGFSTKFLCGCGNSAATHRTITETREERLSRGHPVGRDTHYKAMGGVTGFSSLMEGYLRLDPSGKGTSSEAGNQPIKSTDHPFLRDNANSIRQSKISTGGTGADDDLAESTSAARRPDETDMEYYERRSKEREKQQRLAARTQKPAVRRGPASLSSGAISSIELEVQSLSVRGSTCQTGSDAQNSKAKTPGDTSQ